MLGLMLLLCAPMFVDLVCHDAPRAEAGVISYRGWGRLTAPVELSGQWRLVWLGHDGSAIPPGATTPALVPGQWSGLAMPDGQRLPPSGLVSYRLILRDLAAGHYTLHIPITFAAERIYIDGRPVAGAGRIATNAAGTRYDLRSHEISFETNGAPVALRIDLAAFLHRDNGFVDALIFGEAQPMRRWIALEWMKDLLFHSALLLLALNALVAYLFRRQDRASLYLALAALCAIPGTAILSYDNILLLALPFLNFTAVLALQYIPTAASIGFFLAYSRALFPRETPRWLFRVLLALVGAFFLAQCLAFSRGDTLLASHIAVAWPAVLGFTLLGVIGIVLRAVLRGRDGALVFLLGIAIFTIFSVNAALVWSDIVPDRYLLGTASLPLGMLMLLFSHFVVVAERWTLAIVAAERINADLRELIEVTSAITSEMQLDTLLARIVEVTSRILNADRSTLLLHDERTGELWSLVAEGLTTREIRMDASEGLAGHAFTHGEVLNIADAYADPRFNRAIDIATDYRTGSILTMPVTARDGRRLGVMQTLNRRDGRPFGEDDVTRMVAFAAQAAIAIDNATLFAEVVTSRNYNESILRSMSSGVVTLDRDAGIAKLNAAASAILGVPADQLEGVDARALLASTNPWLLTEIEAVAATGERKLLIDVDLVTVGERVIATNITIVPLIGENGPAGLLLLIEDISEGKRMQSAMRRFMTQKVVDQVLQRGDELLFGTACNASVLFADIRNFTTMAEALTPRETVDMLNEAFTEFFEAVAANDGVLDKFIGDAIMAVYGAPLPTGRDPENAVESAVQMLRALHLLNERRGGRALPPLRLGVGIATGEVVAGTIGSPKRMDYTVIGDSVNLSSRLQDLTKGYGVEVLVCETTAAAVAGRHPLRELDLILVRGRQRPAKIFQVLIEPADEALLDHYQRGRDRLAARDWTGAATAFRAALVRDPADRPAQLMLARAEALATDPPAADWNGVWHAAAK
ncbi:adenylate/guanylate cyclase domain-containing protein [Sphingomonas solaris]|uniref:GAF domain-containing protein n=1 Tax=Alterirhizorhabdus solaris TaxID=2529389 RepID=A0A558R9Q8_9SPHN|nr:adenylate/guanylate cyclase domain-containing protein [Sphingomonas solaris]TVV76120.1 GAF domain-containing protein [Sphingomonas solaris]